MQVTEVLPDFADAFPFTEFNEMQQEALPAVLQSTANVVVSAPTASGKTALAELAICKTLTQNGRVVFLAPLRALTNEKEQEWERFESLGYSVYVVTGERDLNPARAMNADVLVMTPEKLDSATRTKDSPRYDFVNDIDCCVIDEVQLLDSDRRGSVLEVTISRLRRICDPRMVALSATMTNVNEVAEWLDAPPENTFSFGKGYRPVPLHAAVKTYSHGDNAFADKYRRLYRAMDIMEPHLTDDGQGLVFVSSRQDTVQAAKKARDIVTDRGISIGNRGEYSFHESTQALSNTSLREVVVDGVAFHHAGLSREDKSLVEEWFRDGHLALLFSTSTLAWGVNLPARCVVIRDTKIHDPLEGEIDMSPIDVLQMLGRAGRPSFDSVGYGWIIADQSDADKYRELLNEGKAIESRLAEDLDSHLVAEIALGMLRNTQEVMEWLETTFYAVRAKNQSVGYGITELREQVSESLTDLVRRGFVNDEEGLSGTALGRLTSKFYLRLRTADQFQELARSADVSDEDIIECVARAEEFNSVTARRDEVRAIDSVVSGEYSLLSDGQEKVLAILIASMRDGVPDALASDAWVIKQNSYRLFSALRAFCEEFGDPRVSHRVRCVAARIEHGVGSEAVGLTAIQGVGSRRAELLEDAGITDPTAVREVGKEGLIGAGLSDGVAEELVGQAAELPEITLDWGDFPSSIAANENTMAAVTVRAVSGAAKVGIRVCVNGVEMSSKVTYLRDEISIPVGVFGAEDPLRFEVAVTFPRLPLPGVRESHEVRVTGC